MPEPRLEITEVGPDAADRDVDAIVEVLNASRTGSEPWFRGHTRAELRDDLVNGYDLEPPVHLLGRLGDRPVADASYATSQWDNRHLAWCTFDVHPDLRRQGLGSQLVHHLRRRCRAEGRTSLGTAGPDNPATRGFVGANGMSLRLADAVRRLTMADPQRSDPAELIAQARQRSGGYDVIRVEGSSDPHLRAELADLTGHINDAPRGGLDMEDELFPAERIANFETAQTAHHRLYRVFARHRGSGRLAAQTILVVDAERPTDAFQLDTTVANDHRGHRLGLLLKATMLDWLAETEPALTSVTTWNATDNTHMIAVNEQLGYRWVGDELQAQTDREI